MHPVFISSANFCLLFLLLVRMYVAMKVTSSPVRPGKKGSPTQTPQQKQAAVHQMLELRRQQQQQLLRAQLQHEQQQRVKQEEKNKKKKKESDDENNNNNNNNNNRRTRSSSASPEKAGSDTSPRKRKASASMLCPHLCLLFPPFILVFSAVQHVFLFWCCSLFS